MQDLEAVERLEALLEDEKPKTAAAAQAAMRKLAAILKEQVRWGIALLGQPEAPALLYCLQRHELKSARPALHGRAAVCLALQAGGALWLPGAWLVSANSAESTS